MSRSKRWIRGHMKKTERGDIVDYIASLWIMMLCFALILLIIGSAKSIQMRLAIDNVAKEYLYQMEEDGYLSPANESGLINSLTALGVYPESIVLDGTNRTQVAYGNKVTLHLVCEFDNPLFTLLGKQSGNSNEFKSSTASRTIRYEHQISSTSKW